MAQPPESAAPHDELLVADSFRVRAPRGRAEVRGLDRHTVRFARSVDAASRGAVRGVGGFLDGARLAIAEYGPGFPRWELWRDAASGAFGLRLSLRPLPELADGIELRSATGIELEHPERKGPNLARLAALNRELGAEALLLADDGSAIEGATTAILWWDRGELRVSAARARVRSVAEALVREAAAAAGIRVVPGRAAPAELAAREVWAVNALHGIRRVWAIDGIEAPEPDSERLARFRTALDATWQDLAPSTLRIK
ncbi:aminotransferase class IV [Leucobacter sp. HNU]|uniref:aminotransferase class IV n=1 Tax=Leucobacter sp. HNU TaxID=3236805 RepID=UPI003A812B85